MRSQPIYAEAAIAAPAGSVHGGRCANPAIGMRGLDLRQCASFAIGYSASH